MLVQPVIVLHDEWWVDVVIEWQESFGKVMKKSLKMSSGTSFNA